MKRSVQVDQSIQPGLPIPPMTYRDKLVKLLQGDLDFHGLKSSYASHNFHSFPAKFPPQLPETFILGLTQVGEIVLDPMAGSGTTIVEASTNYRLALGFDIDPLAARITKVKVSQYDPNDLFSLGKKIIENARSRLRKDEQAVLEERNHRFSPEALAFLDQWFLPPVQIELLSLIHEIEKIENQDIKTFFEVCFSAIIITKSGGVSLALDLGHTRPHLAKQVLDKTGEILFSTGQNQQSHLRKIQKSVFTEFEKRIQQNLNGISNREIAFIPQITFGNSQQMPLGEGTIDLIVTSPPYASNAIDYMRAHKFSLVWLGYPLDMLTQKRSEYIGGESTTNFHQETLSGAPLRVVDQLAQVDPKKSRVLHRYYSEMTRTLKEMYRVLKPGKAAIVVVGNSIMRNIDTETPLCLSEIGKSVGFEVPAIGIRHLDRDRRMLPAGSKLDSESVIQQRMHEEYVIGYYKPTASK